MTIKQIEELLQGRFSSDEDRKYWEDKLQEMKIREARIQENEKYFRKMRKYDRL